MENITITRISDLPTGGGTALNQNQSPSDGTYMPMNIHPNPYGMPQQPSGLPPPIQTQEGPKQMQNMMYMPPNDAQFGLPNQVPVQRLNSRDIPQNMDGYNHDEQIQPNYIPKPKTSDDYIQEYQNSVDHKVREYESKKEREKQTDSWFDEIRIPVIVAILFFIFHMPILNTLIFKRFSFLSIYNDDGNFNFYGLILKSAVFGTAFYFLNKVMEFLSSI
jgi:hypothetical protein